MLRYQEIEKEYAADPRMHIVPVGSDSLDTVKVAHADYFAEGPATVEAWESCLRSFTERFVFTSSTS